MGLEEALATHLRDAEDVKRLVADRVHPLRLPQNPTLPAITYQRITTPDVGTHDGHGVPDLVRPRVQLNCYAADGPGVSGYDASRELARAVRRTLNGFRGDLGGMMFTGGVKVANVIDVLDPIADRWRVIVDVTVWTQEDDEA